MKYSVCNQTIKDIANCFSKFYIIKPIHEINCREDDSMEEAYDENNEPIFNDEYQCIDLDEFEKAFVYISKNRKNRYSSVDMAFCVVGNSMVLVEYRLNYKVPQNLNKEEMDCKVRYSSRYIRHCFKYQVHPKKYFVFPKNKVSIFKNRMNRMNPKCSPDYIACTIQELFNEFFI